MSDIYSKLIKIYSKILEKSNTYEDLYKSPLVFEGDSETPFVELWRIQNDKGHGPYHGPGMQGGSKWWDSSHGTGTKGDNTPSPFDDPGFTLRDKKALPQFGTTEGEKPFAFESMDQLNNWFSKEELDKLAYHGYKPVKVKAKKVWSSGKQAFYMPYKEKLAASEDKIKGGLADKKTPKDFNLNQLNQGVKVEMEHTSDKKVAQEIAMDHLVEDKKYYTKLKEIHTEKSQDLEKGLKGDWKKEGYSFKHNIYTKENPKDKNIGHRDDINSHEIIAFDLQGNIAGKYSFHHYHKGKYNPITKTYGKPFLEVWSGNTDPEHQRKGLASHAYSLVEKVVGLPVQIGISQSNNAKALWQQPNRPFGKSELTKSAKDNNSEVASIAVRSGNNILMGKRKNNNRWTLPGGHLDKGESKFEGAIRELFEEAGIKVEAKDLNYLGSEEISVKNGKKLIHAFEYKHDGEKPTTKNDPDKEVSKWEWIECDKKLPKEVEDNLHSPKNVVFKKLGLQDWKLEKSEILKSKPMILDVHHGTSFTDKLHTQPDPKYSEWGGNFFTTNKQHAKNYAEFRGIVGNPAILHGKLTLNNPYHMTEYDLHRAGKMFENGTIHKFYKQIKSKGYDGIVFPERQGTQELMAFHQKSFEYKGHSINNLRQGKGWKTFNKSQDLDYYKNIQSESLKKEEARNLWHNRYPLNYELDDEIFKNPDKFQDLLNEHIDQYYKEGDIDNEPAIKEFNNFFKRLTHDSRNNYETLSHLVSSPLKQIRDLALQNPNIHEDHKKIKEDADFNDFVNKINFNASQYRRDIIPDEYNDQITTKHLAFMARHGYSSVRLAAANHMNTTEEIIREAIKNSHAEDGTLITNHNMIHDMLSNRNAPDDLVEHFSKKYHNALYEDLAREHGLDVDPIHKVAFGTTKLRTVRDLIQAHPEGKMHKKDLERLGLNPQALAIQHLQDKEGKISHQDIQNHIDSLPKQEYGISDSTYGEKYNIQDENEQLENWMNQFNPKDYDVHREDYLDEDEVRRYHEKQFDPDDYVDKSNYELDENDIAKEAQNEGTSVEDYISDNNIIKAKNGKYFKQDEYDKAVQDAEYDHNNDWDINSYSELADYEKYGDKYIDSRNYDRAVEDAENQHAENFEFDGHTPEKAYEDAYEAQQHSYDQSQVMQLNFTKKHRDLMKEAGVWDTFKKIKDKTHNAGHPVEQNTLGWVRYTEGDDGIHIDEIQSDFGQSFVKKAHNEVKEALREGRISEEAALEAIKRANEEFPEEHHKKINEILFSNKHPNEVLHEAFHQYMRDKGKSGKPIHIWKLKPKANISNQDLYHTINYDKAKAVLNDNKEAMKELFPNDSHIETTKNWLASNNITKDNLKEHYIKTYSEQSGLPNISDDEILKNRSIRLEAKIPGYMNVTYNQVPKKMGYESKKYGELSTQHNPDLQGQDTWGTVLRKSYMKQHLEDYPMLSALGIHYGKSSKKVHNEEIPFKSKYHKQYTILHNDFTPIEQLRIKMLENGKLIYHPKKGFILNTRFIDKGYGKELDKNDTPIKLVHFSRKSGLKEIDPQYMGTGTKSEEYKRGLPEIARSYYYRHDSQPEPLVTQGAVSKYTSHIMPSEIYDLYNDSHNLVKKAIEENQNIWNSDVILGKIRNAGFKGFHNSGSNLPHVVALFGPHKVESEEIL